MTKAEYGLPAAALGIAMLLGAAAPVRAAEDRWSVELEPIYMELYGHDQHVLTIHRFEEGAPQSDRKTAARLDTESGPAYRLTARYRGDEWSWGLEYFMFLTSQVASGRRASAGDGTAAVRFEVADRTFTSQDPGAVLYYDLLEDTDLEAWTLDLYGLRKIAERPSGCLRLQLGLRFADFDNDYRAVVGIEGAAGSRLDASSNYDRMTGPLVGLVGEIESGKNRFEGYLGQSVVLGTVELTGGSREFLGPYSGDDLIPFAVETFRTERDVAIPISELRIRWHRRITRRLSIGASANSSVWWDVPVPPGVVPGVGADQALLENTLVFVGLGAAVKVAI